MTLELVRDLWEYHHWANRRLFGVTAALGAELAGRELGTHFSVPTLRGMLVHIYDADRYWLDTWKRHPLAAPAAPEIRTLADLREPWNQLEAEQRRFIAD